MFMKTTPNQIKTLVVYSDNDACISVEQLCTQFGMTRRSVSSLEEAKKIIPEFLPWLIICQKTISDGEALDLQNHLNSSPILQRIPMLVNIGAAHRGKLGSYANKGIAGFFVDLPQQNSFNRLMEQLIAAKLRSSPYAFPAKSADLPERVEIEAKAAIVGRFTTYLLLRCPLMAGDSSSGTLHVRSSTLGDVAIDAATCTSFFDQAKVRHVAIPYQVLNNSFAIEKFMALPELKLTTSGTELKALRSPPRRVVVLRKTPSIDIMIERRLEESSIGCVFPSGITEICDTMKAGAAIGGLILHQMPESTERILLLKTLDDLPDWRRPTLIIGAEGQIPPSSERICYVPKPFDMDHILPLLETGFGLLEPQAEVTGKSVDIPATIYFHALLESIDEQGLVLTQEFHANAQAALTVTNQVASKVFDTAKGFKTGGVLGSQVGPAGKKYSIRYQPAIHPAALLRSLENAARIWAANQKQIPDAKGSKPKSLYDVQIINTFVNSVYEVFEYYCGVLPALGKSTVKSPAEVAQPLADQVVCRSIVEGTAVTGSMTFLCNRKTIADIGRAFAGESPKKLLGDEKRLNEIGVEVCDQIFGKARLLLETMGLLVDVSVPTVVGPNSTPPASAPVLVIPFKAEAGELLLNILFRQKLSTD